ncbi:HAD family hydrolase [Actinomyces gaoshouyii]|uniref:Haloacid dehalogenase n=1 Tax=Actinomyces gaoshouyii TaxID=1960083 RepID=A0A8H9HBW7_9ACTO|nr:HAD family hydrolase [Actinomyces gaoshouyii]ARD41085.1 haloacid dehalogenase [Actinomyces gaoshouyii]GGO94626.1 hypothetical protein GCM10011612_00490 [Actinomyces gaoshouyii]
MRRLIVTDLDSTIIFNRGVSRADREAMTRWRAAGNLLAIDTGKSIFAARGVLEPEGVRFDYGIVFTGAVLIDSDYRVLAARYLPDGVARAIVEDTAELPGVTTYATTIAQDYILADNNGDASPILQVFEPMSAAQMGEHRFIGVPLRVTDDFLRERIEIEAAERWGTGIECHRNLEFLDIVPTGSSKGHGLAELLAGPLADTRASEGLEVWTIGDSYNDVSMHALADHPITLPWAPPEVSRACERVVGSMAELIDGLLGQAPPLP